MIGAELNYTPPVTVRDFMVDDESLFRCLVGPIGSGKSMGCIMEVLRRARQQKPDQHGVRHTRWAIIRNTNQQLRQTVLADIRQYLQPMIRFFTTDSTVQIRCPMGDGTSVVSDWLLIPLDTAEDQKRLLSMQLTGAWINELREVNREIIDPLIGRLGRYPSKAMGGPTWFGLIGDTNPWDTDNPYHQDFVLKPLPSWTLYHQPSALSPQAENVENLPPGYYANLAARGEEWAQVHIESQWGTSNAGQAVFRRSFHVPTHVRDMQVVVNPHRPLMLGMDFGRTPCALIAQVDTMGRLLIFDEIVTEDIGLIQMVAERLKPVLLSEPYLGKRSFVIADPAGRERSQLSEQNAFDALRDAGLQAYPASTNDVEPRLLAVERLLRSTLMGEPALQIRRDGCPQLIRALAAGYRYKRKRDGRLEDRPEKNHPHSDLADCLQYLALGVHANYSGHVMRRSMMPAVKRDKMPAAAWT